MRAGIFLARRRRCTKARELMREYDIRAPGPQTLAARLSGGNQQKIVVARELDRKPAVLIAHQAAWGLDPGATRFVLERVLALREAGAAIALFLLRTRGSARHLRSHRGDGERRLRRRHDRARGRPRADRPLDVRAGGMSEAAPPPCAGPRERWPRRAFRLRDGEAMAARIGVAVASLPRSAPALLVALSGHNPLAAFAAMAIGAVGSPHQIGVALNRATPYLLAGSGVAICFRAGVINIGAEGQIALGRRRRRRGRAALAGAASALSVVAALIGAAAFGALWAGLATAIHLGRRVHEVLATLLLNFVALLLVQQMLAGPLGQFGAGFLQSPRLPRATLAVEGAGVRRACRISHRARRGRRRFRFVLWRTPFGFAAARRRQLAAAPRPMPASPLPRITWGVMLIAGALAGLAGGVEVLGVHHRLIEGFSLGFGFKAVTVALLGALEPLAVVPAALFVGLLEAGSLSRCSGRSACPRRWSW